MWGLCDNNCSLFKKIKKCNIFNFDKTVNAATEVESEWWHFAGHCIDSFNVTNEQIPKRRISQKHFLLIKKDLK